MPSLPDAATLLATLLSTFLRLPLCVIYLSRLMISINGLLNRFRRHQDGSSSRARSRIFPTESTVDVCECLYLFMRSNVRCSYGSSLGAIEAIGVVVQRAESILPFPFSPFAFCLIKCALINQSKRASSEPLVERAIINIAGNIAQCTRQWRSTVPHRSQVHRSDRLCHSSPGLEPSPFGL